MISNNVELPANVLVTSSSIPRPQLPPASVLRSVAAALVGGVTTSTLAFFQRPGIGLALGAVAAVLTWIVIARQSERPVKRREAMVLAALALFGMMPSLRASTWLHTYDALAAALLVLLLPWAARARDSRLTLADTGSALGQGLHAGLLGSAKAARDGMTTVTSITQMLKGPLVGVAVALPFLAVFAALFAGADAVFADVLSRAATSAFGPWLSRVAGGLVIAWVMCGLSLGAKVFRSVEACAPGAIPDGQPRGQNLATWLGQRELLWAVLSISAVFVLFLVVQAVQLVGFGEALAAPGVTYSSVAREGFFQLLAVVALVVAVVLAASWFHDGNSAANASNTRRALSLLLVLTAGVAVTALWRMARYADAYGLTELRFHASAAMVWLVAVLLLLQTTVLSRRRSAFIPVLLAGTTIGLLLLNVANPDSLIARVNLMRGAHGGEIDFTHLASLSDDALPTIDAAVPTMPAGQRARACQLLTQRQREAQRLTEHAPQLSLSVARVRAASLTTCASGS